MDKTLLDRTLDAAIRDPQTVTPDGRPVARLPHGMKVRPAPTHVDRRGSVTEMFDARWDFHPAPVEFVYTYSLRPGMVKGWGMHRKHEDRYFLMRGEMQIVMYDVRPDSPTCGEVSSIVLSERNHCLVTIPIDVWHANYNPGSSDAIVVNFPTMPYDHADPDKLRLPLDTPLIPYDWSHASGW